MEGYSYDEVSFVRLAWYISGPWHEDGSSCIWCSDDNWKLGVVDPPLLPVNSRLGRREPWVAQNRFVFSQVREEEPHGCSARSRSDVQVGVISQFAAFIFCAVDVQ